MKMPSAARPSATAKSTAAHHAISALFSEPLDFSEMPLVVQYEVKYQKGSNCGGSYLGTRSQREQDGELHADAMTWAMRMLRRRPERMMKLLEDGYQTSGKEFSDETPWVIMFSPNLTCPGTKIHFIFHHKNPITGEYEEKHLTLPPKPSIEKTTNLYTLVLHPNNTYDVLFNKQSHVDCEAICKLELKAKILTHIRCHMDDVQIAVETGVDSVDIVIGTSFLREFSHGKDMIYITKTAIEVINFIKSKGIEVHFSTEDSFHSDLIDLLSIYQTVDKIGINRIGIADTVGGANPRQVYDLVRTLRGVVSCDIEIHLHNDTGMAIANAYTALKAIGNILENFTPAVNPLKEIDDPEDKKPED
ncbi:hypothetical protein EW146_g4490 [Bondarzewia mesenterica]|uniref:Pyruvate carboxyltransferase domain-containing protein n=1 Tax=Bondarzewia mesenterica TaxID=1095465 RepID=A0A4S4LVH2_9AGAM|nr:hypothetical protein EW146_g4490 [Bondarzewia mesenterica]